MDCSQKKYHEAEDSVYDFKLKILEEKINCEFKLVRQELKTIQELLQEKKAFFTRINASVIICILSSIIAVVFEIMQRISK